ncbi:hypothetical protein F5Y15DRAFT_416644 [Xylariaceae sp. FL0016]|nr:hypothetical protein F5Y15DRAFT_416644 [Xylariaceae sp. FL0016]
MKTSSALIAGLAAMVKAQQLPVDLVSQDVTVADDFVPVADPVVAGYTLTGDLEDAAMNAPNDCDENMERTIQTFIGSRVIEGSWSPVACAAICDDETADPDNFDCNAFNSYRLYKNGVATAHICSMYSMNWGEDWANNAEQWRDGDHYTVHYSFMYANTTHTVEPECPDRL